MILHYSLVFPVFWAGRNKQSLEFQGLQAVQLGGGGQRVKKKILRRCYDLRCGGGEKINEFSLEELGEKKRGKIRWRWTAGTCPKMEVWWKIMFLSKWVMAVGEPAVNLPGCKNKCSDCKNTSEW